SGRKARLDIYRPAGAVPVDAPVLVQIHGGGWSIGTKEQQGLLLMNRMAAHGWVCVAVNYRLAPKYAWPTQIVDVKRALAWVHEHVAAYGGDPSYVTVTGGSAGGHLAALAALTPNDPTWQPGFEQADTSVAACVPFYGVYDMAGDDGDPYTRSLRDGFLRGRLFANDASLEAFREASPLHHITADAPDFFVLHGDIDTVVSVRQARAFVARLREVSKASVSYAEIPGAQHAFDVFGSIRAQHAVHAVGRWLEWHHATWAAERAS
ncbi:MAG: alpha/beta hydrolase, partial [Nocardioides sp.]|nr:alpha/beta hydrolase [Nocardioides sp.]